jgi:opacity protein-like surface antigen
MDRRRRHRSDDRWTLKLEYLHADLGSAQLFDIVPGIPETVDLRIDSVRVGLNYRFDATALHLH